MLDYKQVSKIKIQIILKNGLKDSPQWKIVF